MMIILPRRTMAAATLAAMLAFSPAAADRNHTLIAAPQGHAPIMVMGDHMHKAGEVMVSLRQMSMKMSGNIKGTQKLSDAQVLAEANQFSAMPMMAANLRVVPQAMDMHMTMLGAMYAPSDKVTLLAMLMQIDNDMTLTTYQGMTGTDVLGRFSSKSSGLGDTVIGALIAGGETARGAWHYGLALSLPTGAIDKTAPVLTPMNIRPVKRLPYPMQLGSGSYDLKPSLSYNGDWRGFRVGAQASGIVHLNDNDAGYRRGDKFELQGWVMKNLNRWASASLRLDASHQAGLRGRDLAIALPVPTAQTGSQGGTMANLSLGVNLIGQTGVLANHRLALELVMPVHQDAKGVQMQRDETLMLGWQKAF